MKLHVPELGEVATELRAAREALNDPRPRPLVAVLHSHRAPEIESALWLIGFALLLIGFALNVPPSSGVAGRRPHA